MKENNKYKLKIEFLILRKKRNILIDLNENKLNENKVNDDMNDIINNYEIILKEKYNIILNLKEVIRELEKQLKEKEKEKKKEIEKEKEKNENKIDNLYNNFNIQIKKPIQDINTHKNSVFCLSLLNDRRLASSSGNKNIIIYNKLTFQPEITIKGHNDNILCIIQLN